MSELNINIKKNGINSQNLRINMPSLNEGKDQNKNLNVSSNFYKAVSNFIEQHLHPRKKIWTRDLLLELNKKPTTFRSINDLGKSTQLNNIVYPVLAKLHRQGLVETKLYKDRQGTMLAYRLTKRGFVHSKAVLA